MRTEFEFSETGYAIAMDGDYTYPAKRVWDLCRELDEGYDMVIGVS